MLAAVFDKSGRMIREKLKKALFVATLETVCSEVRADAANFTV